MKRAARIMTAKRKLNSTPEIQIFIPRNQPNPWRCTGPLAKENLMSKYTISQPVMSKYLAKVNQSGLQIPESVLPGSFHGQYGDLEVTPQG